jgi:hypothetical protein
LILTFWVSVFISIIDQIVVGCLTFSYRLELMRQIYNTAESPDMIIYQLMDVMPSVGNGDSTPTSTHAVSSVSKIDPANGQSSSKNTSRLSLANLLPSRLENDLNFNFEFHYSSPSFANFFVSF